MGITIRLQHDRNLGTIFRFSNLPVSLKVIFAVIPDACLGPIQGSRLELFCKDGLQLKFVNYFHKKASSEIIRG